MDERENARYWEQNAVEWTRLVRLGYDRARDHVNNPSFFALLPDVRGLGGLDLGCGEGYNTRLVADRGARVTALDIAWNMLRPAAADERTEPRGIGYVRGSGVSLPFADGSFDFVVAFMSLQDMPHHDRVFAEIARVLRAGGFLQFSTLHPCFGRAPFEWAQDEAGVRRGRIVSQYFRALAGDVEEWTFGAARRDGLHAQPFRIPVFSGTLADWLNGVVDCGLVVERIAEPRPDEAALAQFPALYSYAVVPNFLQVRARKPAR
jgi:ubiquinone/menaquinone biosynthesis C-methylase UbiE